MIQIELSGKALVFVTEAVEYRIASMKRAVAETVSDDEISDLQNDTALLNVILQNLKNKRHEFRAKNPDGDATNRAKLKLIIQCLYAEGFSEAEQNELINMGSTASRDPSWTDYIYWPGRYGLDGSIEAALDKIFSHKPILL
jgi:hypothetical protein